MGGQRRISAAFLRATVASLTLVAALAAAMPAGAQQIFAQPPRRTDAARVSGFLWRSKPAGTIDFAALDQVEGFENGLDLVETLGLTEPENGWIFEGNFGAGRHRFIIEFSNQENSGEQSLAVTGVAGVRLVDLIINVQSNLRLRELHAYYNLLLVARPSVELGLLGGVGYFDAEATASSSFALVSAQYHTPFPVFGGNVLLNPQGPLRGYFELTGFPRVRVNDDIEGWQMDLVARVEVFPVRNVGIIVGYRRYRLVFDPDRGDVDLDLMWDGLTFGGQVRF